MSLLGLNRKQSHIVLAKHYLSMQFFFLITEAFSGISFCLKQLWFSSKEKQLEKCPGVNHLVQEKFYVVSII